MVYRRGENYHLDVMVDGVRYREALRTTDRREARAREKERIAEIKAGKVAAPAGRAFSRLPFTQAFVVYQEERRGKVAERTERFEAERSKPLKHFFGDRIVRSIKALLGENDVVLGGGLGLQSFQPLAERLQIVPQPDAATRVGLPEVREPPQSSDRLPPDPARWSNSLFHLSRVSDALIQPSSTSTLPDRVA
jgi:hypothetical protein